MARTTFGLSAVYRALGLRSSEVNPEVQAGILVPTISVGQLQSFSAEVVEARGLFSGSQLVLSGNPGGNWLSILLFSTAKGGTVVEKLNLWTDWPDDIHGWMETSVPYVPSFLIGALSGGRSSLIGTGGQTISTLVSVDRGAGPRPEGPDQERAFRLAPTRTNHGEFNPGPIWIPPGSYLWFTIAQGPTPGVDRDLQWQIAFREIPEGQGPA